jgi:hypothetical protein
MKSIRYLLTALVVLSLYGTALYSQTPSFRVFPNDINEFTQTEPLIVVSPLNPLVMFCSAVTIDLSAAGGGFRSEGVYVTTNGGLNWFGSDTCKGYLITNHGGDPGIAIDKNGTFILKHVGNAINGVYAHYSTDMGATWSNAYTVSQQYLAEDKGSMATDIVPTSSFYGRTYLAWVNVQSPFPVQFSYTTNSGLSWSARTPVNGTPPNRCSGGDLEIGPNGEVYIVWAAVINTIPYTEVNAGFAFSTTGGSSWNVNQNIFAMHGINGTLVSKDNIRVNGLPRIAVDHTNGPRRGWIYVLTTETNDSTWAGNDPDIVMHKSTNNGQTWSAGIRVNQDALNNGKIQYFPAACVDSTGALNVLFFDDRNTTSDSTDVFLSRSTDGGNTWTEFLVSDKRYKPVHIIGNFQGDFISITSARGKLFPVWMGNYVTGTYKIWTTIIDISTIGVKNISTEIPKQFSLHQNYPNPFNPETKIKFSIPQTPLNPPFNKGGTERSEGGFVQLIIYNSLGQQIAEIVNGSLTAGTYEVNWNASGFASGTYFYELTAGDFREVKKMVLVK